MYWEGKVDFGHSFISTLEIYENPSGSESTTMHNVMAKPDVTGSTLAEVATYSPMTKQSK
jgi:hypothetical protein